MHDCIFEYLEPDLLPPGQSAVRCRCHESAYRTRFPIDPPYLCPVTGQVAPAPPGGTS